MQNRQKNPRALRANPESSLAWNVIGRYTIFREKAIILAIEINTLQAKIYASTVKVAEDLSNLGLTKKICTSHKDTGKVFNGYIFVTYTQFNNILPEIFVPGIDTYTLTDIQLNTLLTSYKPLPKPVRNAKRFKK